jgi:transposase
MMFGQGGPVKVFVATRPVDFRKGIDGLSLAVQEMFGLDPFCGAVFVFRSKRGDRIKLLMWDQTGMVLAHKRLEGGKFVWPQVQDGVMRISSIERQAHAKHAAEREQRCGPRRADEPSCD